MSQDQTIFVVDDIEVFRRMLGKSLEEDYRVECFATAEECQSRMVGQLPDLLLLDVDLPGMNGFDFCRQLMADSRTARIQVIFASGLTDLESRLEGYDAGGADFITKPYQLQEVRRKIAIALNWASRNRDLSGQVAESELLTSLILSSLDEYAVLIRFLRHLANCTHLADLSESLFALFAGFHLDGVVQLRMGDDEWTFSAQGQNCPMEVAVINHVRSLDRIFSLGKRSAYNFEHVTLLINNMPTADAELCGRLRDHLAIAAEVADAKVAALLATHTLGDTRGRIVALVASVEQALRDLARRQEAVRIEGALCAQQLQDKLLQSFAALGMSERQEQTILATVQEEVERLISLYDSGNANQQTLNGLLAELSGLTGRQA